MKDWQKIACDRAADIEMADARIVRLERELEALKREALPQRVDTFEERMKNPPKQERIGPVYVCGCGSDLWLLCKNGDCVCSQCLCAQAALSSRN